MSSYTSWKNYHLISKLFNLYHIPQKLIFYEYFFNIRFFSFLAEFREFFSTIEYSRPVEYSMGLKKKF